MIEAENAPKTTDRRAFLGRGLAALAGLTGLRLLGGTDPIRTVTTSRTLHTLASGGKVQLTAKRLHLSSGDKNVPVAGDRLIGAAELYDANGSQKLGELYITATAAHAPFGVSEFAAAHVENQLFVLKDGTIAGIGHVAPASIGRPASFAVVGGTGRYEGVRGSYVAKQNPVGIGGDGQAEYVFNILR